MFKKYLILLAIITNIFKLIMLQTILNTTGLMHKIINRFKNWQGKSDNYKTRKEGFQYHKRGGFYHSPKRRDN